VIGDYRCDGHDHGSRPEEASSVHVVAIVRRGAFVRSVRGEETLADANHVLFFHRDEPYRVRHPARGGDACTTFALQDHRLFEILEAHDPAARERKGRPFDVSHALCGASIQILHQKLYQLLEQGRADELLVDELALRLPDAILVSRPRPRIPRRAASRPGTAGAHRSLAEAAKLVLQRRMRDRVLLDHVASEVGCSPYHLARVFQRETGGPLHRHLNRLRLCEALARLIDGERDLTALALAVGYSDHSHFTNAFRREFGLTPSRARPLATGAELARMSKNLQV